MLEAFFYRDKVFGWWNTKSLLHALLNVNTLKAVQRESLLLFLIAAHDKTSHFTLHFFRIRLRLSALDWANSIVHWYINLKLTTSSKAGHGQYDDDDDDEADGHIEWIYAWSVNNIMCIMVCNYASNVDRLQNIVCALLRTVIEHETCEAHLV